MTTINRMHHFKHLVERFAQGEKLLTAQDKAALMAKPLSVDLEPATLTASLRFARLKLVRKVS